MREVWNWAAAVLLAISASTSAYAGSLSGTYVGTGPDMAVLLQLVDSGGGQLSGRYEQARLLPDPKIERFNAVAKGNVDGDTIVLEMKPTEALSGTFIVSGTAASDALRLTGGGYGTTLNLVLSRASEDVFNSQVAAFSYQVSKIYAVRTLASDVKNLEAISQRMTAFNSRAASELKKLPSLEERFRSQTQAMATALAKQRSIIPTGRSAAIRGQIGVAINQAGVEFNQAHVEYQSSRTAFEATRAGLLKQADALYQKCQSPNGLIDKNSESAKTWAGYSERALGRTFYGSLREIARTDYL